VEFIMVEQADYRLAFILPKSRQLLGIEASRAAELPRISIPMCERPARELTHAIEAKWHIRTIVVDILTGTSVLVPCAIIEVRHPSWQFSVHGFSAVNLATVSGASLSEDERHTLASLLSGEDTHRGPFSRLGWIEEAQEWILEAVPEGDIQFNGEFLQLNGGGSFALLRLGTIQGPAYWLKAVGPPNEREFQITRTLAQLFPKHLPSVVTMREDWSAWVMRDAGRPLRDSFSIDALEQTVACLAELQTESISRLDSLLAAGCLGGGIRVLQEHLSELTEYLEEAMDQQTSTTVPRLEKQRLHQLKCVLCQSCSRILDLNIPDTLIHNDINTGNILCCGTRCVFTDWAEACIGNPFVTFQHLAAQVATRCGDTSPWIAQMTRLYKPLWLEYLDDAAIDKALAITPILAIASYLYGRGDWLRSPQRNEPTYQSYTRSLARHIDQAARSPQLVEALCH
jgi:hypothetical protein